MDKKIYLGLDIGTNSVGWAVTDGNYNISRLKGKDLWGVRKFEEAQSAEERRLKRASRRNLQRRKQRIAYLNEIFKDELDKVDPDFLRSLKESQLYFEDKSLPKKHTLFNDDDFTDKDFHSKYKTINHLIVDLIENGTDDIRLLYLGIHKLLKNRGHFLFENLKVDTLFDFNHGLTLLNELNEAIVNSIGDDFTIDFTYKEKELLSIIKKKDTLRNKNKNILELLSISKTDDNRKQKEEIIKAIIGSRARVSIIFNDDDIKENFENDQFTVDSEAFDNLIEDVVEFVEVEGSDLLSAIKRINDWAILNGILGDNKLISYGMREVYETHRKDLEELKGYIKAYHTSKDYYEMFKNEKTKSVNYVNYVAHSKKHNKKQYTNAGANTSEDFGKFVKAMLKDDDHDTARNIIDRIDKGMYMPKQVSKLNASIPNQLRYTELQLMLEKNKDTFKFLQDVDESGVSNIAKLLKICSFRIPYFVGPLNDKHKINKDGFAWIRKHEGYERAKITPWNYEDIVDESSSNLAFLNNLIGDCTYLMGEKVLPKHSLLNSKHAILNAINKIKINNENIKADLKEKLFYYLINERKISRKTIVDYFIANGIIKKDEENLIEAIDIDFNMNYPAYNRIKTILKDKVDYKDNNDFEVLENIILWATQSSDSKLLKDKLSKIYGDKFNQDEIDKLSKLKFADWGRLSKKFLSGIASVVDYETGESYTIIDKLLKTNYNLQELMDNEYNFRKYVKEFNDNFIKKTGKKPSLYDKVQSLYASAPVKRQIWQTILVLEDLKKVLPKQPDKIFIEMSRGSNPDQKNKRTVSRKKQLIELFSSIKNEKKDWVKDLESREDSVFRSDKVYLYYTQFGKCAYSGESINFGDLFNVNLYDVDHIYPRSKIKDDSLNNKVLVKKDYNNEKGDTYPISSDIRTSMYGFWKSLLDGKFIDAQKFNRLTRSTALTRSECTDFINRQLVETRQSTKLVGDLIEDVFKESKIVYSKAGNIRDFKEFTSNNRNNKDRFDEFVKVREVNDFHHAKDAYLNIVVGNVYNTRFGYNASHFFEKNDVKSYNLKHLFTRTMKGAWYVDGENNSFETVKRNFNKNSCLVTNMTTVKSGMFYDMQMVRATGESKKTLLPIKASDKFLDGKLGDYTKYGGYSSVKNAYMILLKYKKGEKDVMYIEFVPHIIATKVSQGEMLFEDYFREKLKVENIEVLIDKIPFYSLFKINGTYVNITGTTSSRIGWNNANQLILNKEDLNYIKKISNYNKRVAESRNRNVEISINERYDYINKDRNLDLYDTFIDKLNTKVYSNLPMTNYMERLTQKRDIFMGLTLEKQTILLYEILKLFQVNAVKSNLKLIDESENSGTLSSLQNIDWYKEIKLIKQSPTGLFEKVINLKTL